MVLVLVTKILQLVMTTGSLVGSIQELIARAVGTKRDLERTQKTVALSGIQQKTLKGKVLSLMQETS